MCIQKASRILRDFFAGIFGTTEHDELVSQITSEEAPVLYNSEIIAEIMEELDKDISEIIATIAESYEGITEVKGNMGFKDKEFEALMEDVGWQKGEAWCAYFTELVWKKAYSDSPDVLNKLDKLFKAGAVATYNSFKASKEFTVDKHPKRGDLVIWQTWKNNTPHWTGHAGIVIAVTNDNEFISVEGNTNSLGGREGIEVALKHRKLTFDAKNGLVLRGFIHPK